MFNSVWDILQKPLFNVGGQGISIVSFFYFLILVFISVVLARLIIRFLRKRVYSRMEIDKGAQGALSRLVKYGVVIVGVLIGLQMLGVNLSILAFLGGLLGIGLGFGLQNIFQNFACGMILLFEKPVKIGDVVQLDGLMGKVDDIGFRASTIKTFDNESVIVPNSNLVTDTINNLTHGGDTSIRLHIPIGVAYGTDVNKVKETLIDIVENREEVMEEPPPKVVFTEHGDSALVFDLRAWVRSAEDRIKVKDRVREKIDEEFNRKGIEMPYPTRDVYLFFEDEEEKADQIKQFA